MVFLYLLQKFLYQHYNGEVAVSTRNRVPEPNNVQFKIFIGFKNIIISLKRTYVRNSTVIIKGFLIGPF